MPRAKMPEWVPREVAAIKPGDKFRDMYGVVRVMAIADGYVMFRRRGCMPAVEMAKYFVIKFRKEPF